MAKNISAEATRVAEQAETFVRRLRNTRVLATGAEQRVEDLACIVERLAFIVRDLVDKG